MKLRHLILKFFRFPVNLLRKIFRRFRMVSKRQKLTNASFSVFSSNCIGGCMLHDLGMPFNSPFVNLYLNAADYLKFLSNPQKYVHLNFQELETTLSYPVAQLDDITIHFVHYKDFEDAVSAFKRRIQRINWDKLFVIFVERDGCTYEDLLLFDSLPYQHKVVFTHIPYDDIQSAFYIRGFEDETQLGDIIKWDHIIGQRIYDQFDFVQWFNQPS